MTQQLPPIPTGLKSAFAIYVQEFEENLAIFSKKNSIETFLFSEQEQKDFQQRFHRLKGSSGFFRFQEIAELAQKGEALFSSTPKINNFPQYESIYATLSNHLKSLKTV